MTPALRKRHQRTWWFLGLALLVIWGTSMVAISKNDSTQNPTIVNTSEGISISIKNGSLPNTQTVIIESNQALASPQTLVYLTDKEAINAAKGQLLGRLDGSGTFEFPLDSIASAMPKKVVKGYDAIHQKELFSAIIKTE